MDYLLFQTTISGPIFLISPKYLAKILRVGWGGVGWGVGWALVGWGGGGVLPILGPLLYFFYSHNKTRIQMIFFLFISTQDTCPVGCVAAPHPRAGLSGRSGGSAPPGPPGGEVRGVSAPAPPPGGRRGNRHRRDLVSWCFLHFQHYHYNDYFDLDHLSII